MLCRVLKSSDDLMGKDMYYVIFHEALFIINCNTITTLTTQTAVYFHHSDWFLLCLRVNLNEEKKSKQRYSILTNLFYDVMPQRVLIDKPPNFVYRLRPYSIPNGLTKLYLTQPVPNFPNLFQHTPSLSPASTSRFQ